MAYSQCSIMAEDDLSMCSQPSAVPGPEWMFKGGVLEELEIMKGSLRSPQICGLQAGGPGGIGSHTCGV